MNCKLLLVDGSKTFLTVAKKYLVRRGHTVIATTDGITASRLVAQAIATGEYFDLCIIDSHLAGTPDQILGGCLGREGHLLIEFIRALEQESQIPPVKILAISDRENDLLKMKATGATQTLMKGFSPGEFCEVVVQLTGSAKFGRTF